MKPVYICLVIFLMVMSGLILGRNAVVNPEQLIIGTWTEKAWEYEKVNTIRDLKELTRTDTMAQTVKDQLGKHLLIHSAEVWEFRESGLLVLKGKNSEKIARWKLKGRGHVLELEYEDKVKEHYNLTELTENNMVLNFDSDIQVKGIAKLTFDK